MYLIQYILSENQGSATMLINQFTGSDISGKWSIADGNNTVAVNTPTSKPFS